MTAYERDTIGTKRVSKHQYEIMVKKSAGRPNAIPGLRRHVTP